LLCPRTGTLRVIVHPGVSRLDSLSTFPNNLTLTEYMKTTSLLVFGLLVSRSLWAGVVTWPAPEGEVLSSDYEVRVEGKKVDVYTARVLDPPFAGKEWNYGGNYSFANFDMSGKVTVRVTSSRSLRGTIARPESAGVRLKIALVTAQPKPNAPGVIYFGPGVHRPGRIDVTNGQTLYLAGGAVVKGAVAAEGSNIRIAGRGILDGSDYEWRKGPYGVTLGIHGTNVVVEGITIRGSPHWTIVPRGSRAVVIRNVKLCGGRVQNDDGINPCNSQEVLITDCFIRTDDDCVALKGLDFRSPNSNVEQITVENCILWCDRARIFLLGHESRAPYMRGITLRNLDIIHFTMTAFLFEPGEEMRLEDVRVEDVRLNGEGQNEFIRLKPVVNQYMQKKVPGFVRNVRFKNVTLTGRPGPYRVQLSGADAEHNVRDVSFDNVSILGSTFIQGAPQLSIGAQVEGVQFGGPPH
jgi:hypothetical protein